MAVNTTWFPLDGKEGLGLGTVIPNSQANATTNPEYPAPPAKLLDRVQGNMGSEWVYVQASTTVSQYNCVVIDNTGRANNMTSALVASNVYAYGFAQFDATQANGGGSSGDYFWALLKANGGVGVNLSASAGRGVQLYIASGYPGAFTSSVTSNAIMNIALQASIGTSASNPGEAIVRGYILPALNMAVAGATV